MDKIVAAALLDVYGKMLTEKQQAIAGMYYSCDLTLTEIADEYGVSRQSVFDSLSKTEKILEECENNIGFFREKKKKENLIRDLLSFADGLSEEKREELKSILEKES